MIFLKVIVLILNYAIFLAIIFYVLAFFIGAPYVTTGKQEIVKILGIIKLRRVRKMIDLGSGDGRLVIAFAKLGIQSQGVEINPFLVLISKFNIFRSKLSKNSSVSWGNLWQVNLTNFDLIVLYGIPHMMGRLERKLQKEAKKGTFIISKDFKFKNLNQIRQDENITLYQV